MIQIKLCDRIYLKAYVIRIYDLVEQNTQKAKSQADESLHKI